MRIGNHHHHHHHLSSSAAPGSMVAAVASSPALETVSYDFNRSRSSESTEAVHTHHKTEKAKAGASSSPAATPTPSAALVSPSVAPCAYADSRGVPVSPKKIPMTPPRDLSSPFRAFPPASSGLPHQRGAAATATATATTATATTATAAVAVPPSPVRQPFLWCSEDSNASGERPARRPRSSPFLRPSTGSKHCHPKAGGNNSSNSNSNSHHTATGAFLSPIFRSKGPEEAAATAAATATPIEEDNDKGHALDLFAIRRCNAFDEDDDSDDASDESGDPFGVELGLGDNFGVNFGVNFGFSGENHGNGYY